MVYNRLHMKLILAQGNPGPEYALSRHNIGFMALDYLREKQKLVDFQPKSKFQALISELSVGNNKIILAKPTTFYNETGRSARAIADFYKIATNDILLIHDELALDFGTIRVRDSGSDAGNKGVRSLISHIGPAFWRIRIGIKNDLTERIQSADFVLAPFAQAEVAALNASVLPSVQSMIDQFLEGSLAVTSEKIVLQNTNVWQIRLNL